MKATELTIPSDLIKFNKHPSITKAQTIKYIRDAIEWLEVKTEEFFQKIPNTSIYAIRECYTVKYTFNFTENPIKVSIDGIHANCETEYSFGVFSQTVSELPFLLANCDYVQVSYIDINRRSSNVAIRISLNEESEDCNLLDWAIEKYITNEKIGRYSCRNTIWDKQ